MERFEMPDAEAEHPQGNLVEIRYFNDLQKAAAELASFVQQATLALTQLRNRDRLSVRFFFNAVRLYERRLPDLQYYCTRYNVNTEMVEPHERGELIRYHDFAAALDSVLPNLDKAKALKQSLVDEMMKADEDVLVVSRPKKTQS